MKEADTARVEVPYPSVRQSQAGEEAYRPSALHQELVRRIQEEGEASYLAQACPFPYPLAGRSLEVEEERQASP